MPEPSKWSRIIAADPDHTRRYIQRFKDMETQGHDLAGEVRTVDAMVQRNSRILDAGCGPGRVGGRLHALGHTVVGIDVDPGLIAAAEEDYPGPTWVTGDLAEMDLPAQGVEANFDVVVSAGNVMGFLAPSTRVEVLRRFATHLADDGRVIIGFGAGRGYDFRDFLADCEQAGLVLQVPLSTWDLRPFTEDSTFIVAICGKA